MKTFKPFSILFFLLFFFHSFGFTQNSLTWNFPGDFWFDGDYPATIEEATIAVHPKGVYSEVGLYLTISDGFTFAPIDSFSQREIVLDFELPEGSIIHDSWLWVGNDIIRAEILNKWSAEGIYEDIVDRRQDPSILYKVGVNSYQLRVYPLFGGDARKLKISYLIPTEWTSEKVLTSLPLHILELEEWGIEDVKLLVWETDDFVSPSMDNVDFQPVQDSILGNHFEADISSNYDRIGELKYESPLKDGVYLNKLIDGDDQFYQLAVLPKFSLDSLETGKKVLVMFDRDVDNSFGSQIWIENTMRSALKEQFSDDDYFNFLSSFSPHLPIFDEWTLATDENIDEAFNRLNWSQHSAIEELILGGIEFLEINHEENTNALLISNSDYKTRIENVNLRLDDLIEEMNGLDVPFNVFYYQSRDRYSYFSWQNNREVYPGEHFFSNLAFRTRGEYFYTKSIGEMKRAMNSLADSFAPTTDFFDIQTDLKNGFCHSRYSNIDDVLSVRLNQPILQVGKFEGEFPFEVKINTVLNNEIRSHETIIEEADIWQGDSLVREAWFGNRIADLEKFGNSDQEISQIITESMEERVLSAYTAFLCLEPSQGGEPCFGCLDESGGVVLDVNESEIPSDSLNIEVAPNPFTEQVLITVHKPDEVKTSEVTCQIFNSVGMKVTALASENTTGSKVQFKWDGQSGSRMAAAGMYVAVIQVGEIRKSIKLIYQP